MNKEARLVAELNRLAKERPTFTAEDVERAALMMAKVDGREHEFLESQLNHEPFTDYREYMGLARAALGAIGTVEE